jgi:hypothetical protein
VNHETQAAFAELVALAGDVKRALDREAERVATIERVAQALAEHTPDDPPSHAAADRIRRVARETRAQLRDAASGLQHAAFNPALHELPRPDA